jgi:hypothetical protein
MDRRLLLLGGLGLGVFLLARQPAPAATDGSTTGSSGTRDGYDPGNPCPRGYHKLGTGPQDPMPFTHGTVPGDCISNAMWPAG